MAWKKYPKLPSQLDGKGLSELWYSTEDASVKLVLENDTLKKIVDDAVKKTVDDATGEDGLYARNPAHGLPMREPRNGAEAVKNIKIFVGKVKELLVDMVKSLAGFMKVIFADKMRFILSRTVFEPDEARRLVSETARETKELENTVNSAFAKLFGMIRLPDDKWLELIERVHTNPKESENFAFVLDANTNQIWCEVEDMILLKTQKLGQNDLVEKLCKWVRLLCQSLGSNSSAVLKDEATKIFNEVFNLQSSAGEERSRDDDETIGQRVARRHREEDSGERPAKKPRRG